MELTRLQVVINGQVQGVGFRPHVYRIALTLGLTGWVQNNTSGVLIEVQGTLVSSFTEQLLSSLPPLARVDDVQTKKIPSNPHETSFHIITSQSGVSRTMISPDMSPCDQCLKELFDPQSRFHRYPFLNCTHCGPRLTIVRNLPYDRHQTSMDEFPLCAKCQRDYTDPANRRYHAQPTACAHCGPQLSSTIEDIAQALMAGKIIALKGAGGYQLLCDAHNESAVITLRNRKNREAKPFALMVANCQSAELFAEINEHEQQLLMSQSRPIVLLKKKNSTLPQAIAPGLSQLGIMLPSTPLHYLLFNALAGSQDDIEWLDNSHPFVLIATSANLSGHPLMTDDEEATMELASIADLIIHYNRKIMTRVDDSIARIINNSPQWIRRARGYTPERIQLAYSIPTTLALGGHLKNTFCITRGNEAFVSQHIGSLTNQATIEFFHESLDHWLRFLDVRIERIACDLHPDFYTSHVAYEYDLPVVKVQHHHAHLAAVAAEHHIIEPALGLALDGYGYGIKGDAWGGELLLLENHRFQRLGSLSPIPQPGGHIAASEPWRMAAAILHLLGKDDEIIQRFQDKPQASLITKLFQSNIPLPKTSSCGRWFDAASALLGINTQSHYEGQAAMQLESWVTKTDVLSEGWSFNDHHFNMLPLFQHLLEANQENGANLFHGTLIAGLTDWILYWANKIATNSVLLSGGCFLNKVLTEGLTHQLSNNGLRVYLSQRVPPNDGGLSLGQAWIAGHYTREELLCV